MKVIVCKDYDDMSKKAADLVISNIKEKPQIKLGLATGSSPIGLYKNLISANEDGEISFKFAKSVNLDEYIGIDPENDQSYQYFMNENLFNHVSFAETKLHDNVENGTVFEKEETVIWKCGNCGFLYEGKKVKVLTTKVAATNKAF